ncbi:protoheme IX farnesyltransferase [Parafrankia irregularis]|uniref:Protoheme IX farnesyltransferase n=2 Tax=Parafrankia TaxID=2994362 RepID=A0A0S4QKL6_9ACTN|nr:MULTISPECIES: heme o synthase [Parafrankia]MBE3202061.1 protoheme IX farnesyltransferase [Parafrankia sp. CH37]CUU55838.1 protoheme IX farnesyltransferase [Parafrankia irregularis]
MTAAVVPTPAVAGLPAAGAMGAVGAVSPVPAGPSDLDLAGPRSRWARAAGRTRSYIALMKLRVVELLLVSTVPVMLLAERGMPSWWLIVVTLVAGTLSAGSANTINCYVDRDIDQLMGRTKRRPLVRETVEPAQALRFGIVLGIVSTLMFGLLVNWISAALSVGAIAFYVFVYTLGLKRRSPSNIVIGGAAGCFPVLIGWSAVTGTVGWAAVLLFAVIFFWTPPHFWALAIRYKDDYAAAGVPMLPVVATTEVVTRRILLYSYVMVGVSLAVGPVADIGLVYTVPAALLGAWFVAEAHRMVARAHRGEDIRPMRLFHMSISYLTLLFAALAAAALV